MSTTVEVVEKLIQLATKNPNREEAASAALKAVELIEKFSIPIGADVTIIRDVSDYKPPTPEEMSTIDELLKGKRPAGPTQSEYARQRHGGQQDGLVTQDNTPMTGFDAFRQRLIDAWREIRDQRQALKSEIYRYELETGRKFRGEGRRW